MICPLTLDRSQDKALPDHKDCYSRYVSVMEEERYLDHYLRPEDGKLSVLRVQRIKGYRCPPNIKTSWAPPQELSRKKRLWQPFQNGSTHILVWTYEEWLNQRVARTNPCNVPGLCVFAVRTD
jgi:hypothetical protein